MSKNFLEHFELCVTRMENGTAEVQLEILPHHTNSAGIVHGGVLAGVADTVAGAAAFSVLDDTQRVVTTDMHITYLKNVTVGTVTARADLRHKGNRFMSVRVEICSGNDLLVTGSVSFMVVARKID